MGDARTNGFVVTREQLRKDFLVQFSDIRRHTAQSARERFHAGEHNMKPGEKVTLYTQRFRTIVRKACPRLIRSSGTCTGFCLH